MKKKNIIKCVSSVHTIHHTPHMYSANSTLGNWNLQFTHRTPNTEDRSSTENEMKKTKTRDRERKTE